MNIETETLLTAPQVARRLGCHDQTLRTRLEKAGVVPDFLVEAPLRGASPLFRLTRLPELARELGIPTTPHPIV